MSFAIECYSAAILSLQSNNNGQRRKCIICFHYFMKGVSGMLAGV